MKPDFDYERASKGMIVVTKKGKKLKYFKYWLTQDCKKVIIVINWKTKDGEKKKTWKQYKAKKDKVCIILCIEAVLKYWPKFDSKKYDMHVTYGHFKFIKDKKLRRNKSKGDI